MVIVDYKIEIRKENPIKHRGIIFNERIHHTYSKKGGNSVDKTFKDWAEAVEYLPGGLLLAMPEYLCERKLKQYYSTNGKEGWSKNDVMDYLIKLKRNPSYVLELVTKIELEFNKKENGVEEK